MGKKKNMMKTTTIPTTTTTTTTTTTSTRKPETDIEPGPVHQATRPQDKIPMSKFTNPLTRITLILMRFVT